jgi:hypothetical protein
MIPSTYTIVDLAERAGATFAQGFLAAVTLGGVLGHDLNALKIGGVAGGYSVAKYLLVKANGYLRTPAATAPAGAPTPPAPIGTVTLDVVAKQPEPAKLAEPVTAVDAHAGSLGGVPGPGGGPGSLPPL